MTLVGTCIGVCPCCCSIVLKFFIKTTGFSGPSLSFSDIVMLASIKALISNSLIWCCRAMSPGGFCRSPGDT